MSEQKYKTVLVTVETHRRLKMEAIVKGKTLSQVISEILDAGITTEVEESACTTV